MGPSNTPLHTPTDTRPARHRNPQAPPPPGAPHPLSPHFPQKRLLTGTCGFAHVQSPGSRAVTTALPLPVSTMILQRTWALLPNALTCGQTTPLHITSLDPPQQLRGPHRVGAFLDPPRLHTQCPVHPGRSSPAKVCIRKEKGKSTLTVFSPTR